MNCIISPVAPPPVRPVLFQLRLTNINNCPDWVVSAKNVLKQTNNYFSLYAGPGWEVRNCNECVCCRGGESLWVWFLKHDHDFPSLPLLPWVGQSCHIPSHSNRFQNHHSYTGLDTNQRIHSQSECTVKWTSLVRWRYRALQTQSAPTSLQLQGVVT